MLTKMLLIEIKTDMSGTLNWVKTNFARLTWFSFGKYAALEK